MKSPSGISIVLTLALYGAEALAQAGGAAGPSGGVAAGVPGGGSAAGQPAGSGAAGNSNPGSAVNGSMNQPGVSGSAQGIPGDGSFRDTGRTINSGNSLERGPSSFTNGSNTASGTPPLLSTPGGIDVGR